MSPCHLRKQQEQEGHCGLSPEAGHMISALLLSCSHEENPKFSSANTFPVLRQKEHPSLQEESEQMVLIRFLLAINIRSYLLCSILCLHVCPLFIRPNMQI